MCQAAVLIVACTVASAGCTLGGSSTAAQPLGQDQTLSFPIAQDIADFDPALVVSPTDVDILRNVFSGLYAFDSNMHEVPDLAVAFPEISADGLMYTFHLRQGARFSNGDLITADDVLYSWNRSAARHGEFAFLLSPIKGYDVVASGASDHMSGLTRLDAYTVQTVLTAPAGYWLAQVGQWPFWLVDRNVVSSAGEDVWYTRPETLIGSGPFRMSRHVVGASLDFEPVGGWYGGSTGAIRRVHVEVQSDPAMQVVGFESGVFSLIGYGRQALSPTAASHYSGDPTLRALLHLVPVGVSFWAGFNLTSGPFAGVAGQPGRHAFATAIDRSELAAAVCASGTTCTPATGGVVSKGLAGYLGDGTDPNAGFDAANAKKEYQAWDPSGTKVRGLAYTYDTNAFNAAVCANLAAQWKKNLGVGVQCTDVDRQTFFDRLNGSCAYTLFRQGWSADYNSPHDWFDPLFRTTSSAGGPCFSDRTFGDQVAVADGKLAGVALADYLSAGRLLQKDVVYAALLYGVQQYLVHPYVGGVGGTALDDYYWTQARILPH